MSYLSGDVLEIDGKEHPIPVHVLEHFRRVRSITKLEAGLDIHVIDAPFVDRRHYLDEVLGTMAASHAERVVVFLDPDTGLAPRRPDLKHVLDAELAGIWREMKSDDLLVLYQHQTNRNGAPWVQSKQQQFEAALGLSRGEAKLAHGPKVARDVVFFYAKKGRAA